MMRVVVIEDEDYFRKELVLLTPWNELGCEVVGEASNGLEGAALVRKLLPDIVITDIRMPGLDGLEMIGELQETLPETDLPLYVIISGYGEFQYARSAIRYGVKNYLLKPVDDAELHETIRSLAAEAVERRRHRKLQDTLERIPDSRIMLFKEYLGPEETSTRENYVLGAVEYIKSRYREEISIGSAAAHLGISESYLSRLFRAETSYTFLEYLTNYRLRKAIELLRDKGVRVYEAAGLVGYRDSRYFGNVFRRYVGVTPREFMNGLNPR
jgi:two-component system response regulator YesN